MNEFNPDRACPICSMVDGVAVIFCTGNPKPSERSDPPRVQQCHPYCEKGAIDLRTPHVHRLCTTCGYHFIEELTDLQRQRMNEVWGLPVQKKENSPAEGGSGSQPVAGAPASSSTSGGTALNAGGAMDSE